MSNLDHCSWDSLLQNYVFYSDNPHIICPKVMGEGVQTAKIDVYAHKKTCIFRRKCPCTNNFL